MNTILIENKLSVSKFLFNIIRMLVKLCKKIHQKVKRINDPNQQNRIKKAEEIYKQNKQLLITHKESITLQENTLVPKLKIIAKGYVRFLAIDVIVYLV